MKKEMGEKVTRLEAGHVYRLIYTLDYGRGKYKYEATMTYLGYNPSTQEMQFNLRPVAGTQSLPKKCILAAYHLGDSRGREDPRHSGKKRLGKMPKEVDG
jgi:hypothetical protein